MVRNSLVALLILLCPVCLFATTPSISNVTGTVSQGQTLTISGSTMVDEDKTNWINATSNDGPDFTSGTSYGFEGSGPCNSDGSCSAGQDKYYWSPDDSNHRTLIYDSDIKLMGNKSLRGNDYGAEAGHNLSTGAFFYTTDPTEMYVRWYSRWGSTGSNIWPTNHVKMIDLPASTNMWYWQPPATGGTTLPTQLNMRYGDVDHYYTINNFLQLNRWYCFETRLKISSPLNWTTWVDNLQIASATPSASDGVHLGWFLFNAPNLRGTDSTFNFTMWTDNMTVSSARVYCSTMVEICNSATYSGATCVKQPLTTISDNSIVITADLTGLTGDKYLYVTNNKQETSSAYNLSGETSPAKTVGGTLIQGAVCR